MDFFAGSGTVGECCLDLNRQFILVDNHPEAIQVMRKRFAGVEGIEWIDASKGLKDLHGKEHS